MGTHIKFRQKVFGGKAKEVAKFIKTPGGIVTTTALGVSSANLATNLSRHENDKKYQKKQIEAMDRLTKSISGLDETMNTERNKSKAPLIKFRQKI